MSASPVMAAVQCSRVCAGCASDRPTRPWTAAADAAAAATTTSGQAGESEIRYTYNSHILPFLCPLLPFPLLVLSLSLTFSVCLCVAVCDAVRLLLADDSLIGLDGRTRRANRRQTHERERTTRRTSSVECNR
jgi:hypothetical protein